ncbi:MAG: patatin-like phospholipase family protein [Solirubrobacterales bacterium]
MAVPEIPQRAFAPPPDDAFRILSIDGGGIRGLIPAMVLAHLEELIARERSDATLAESFDLMAGTSTGGLIALGLATPRADGRPAMRAEEMFELYRGPDARRIFSRPFYRRLPGVGRLSELLDPKYGLDSLAEVLAERYGEATLSEALCELLITSYDMKERRPRFFKRYREESARLTAIDAGLATAAAPTYFPAYSLGEEALVDGGVFASNPTIAAIVEALKRTDAGGIERDELLVISLGTGHHESGFEAEEIGGWGAAEWILPKGGDSPLLGAIFDGQSDASDHWAHVLLNHDSEADATAEPGAGPHYYRFQVDLPEPIPLDATNEDQLQMLQECGWRLIEAHADELEALAEVLSEGNGPPPGGRSHSG